MRQPPERIELDHPHGLVLLRTTVDHAGSIAQAVGESVSHLSRFMPWAQDARSRDPQFQHERLQGVVSSWEHGEGFQYVVCLKENPCTLLGCVGMMTRLGPGTCELGYWVHARHEGKGYILSACRALTDIALATAGVGVVYICCDPDNRRSMTIPKALGFSDNGTQAHPLIGTSRTFSKRRLR